jgi:hypothetical protein
MNGSTGLCRFIVPAFRFRPISIRGALARAVLPAVAGALALVLAGCSGGTAASTSASASATATASTSAFETCLKQHGVKITPGQFRGRPTGSFSPGARPSGSFSPGAFPTGSARPSRFAGANSAAFKACAKYAPAGFAGGANRTISSSALAAFKSCLSANGVKVTGTTATQIFSELRNATGKTATALRTCEVLIRPSTPTPTPSS